MLIDAPALAGRPEALRVRHFRVDGVPHRVAVWTQDGATPSDTARFVAVADTIVRTTHGIVGERLELRLRDATDGARGMDDLLRRPYDRYAGSRGFVAADREREASATCGCDLAPFFAAHVRGAQPIEWNRWLAVAGWRLDTTRTTAVDPAARPLRATVVPGRYETVRARLADLATISDRQRRLRKIGMEELLRRHR